MKFCANCGAELMPEHAFCTQCGTPVTGAPKSEEKTPSRIAGNDQFNQLKEQGRNYWKWLMQAIKEPSELDSEPNNFGLVSLALQLLLLPLTFWLGIKVLLLELIDLINEISSNAGLGSAVDLSDFTDLFSDDDARELVMALIKHEYIMIVLVGLVVLAVTIGLAVFAMKQFTAKPLEFRDYANQVGHYSAVLVPVEVLLGLYTYFMQSTTGSVLLLLIVLLMMIIGMRALIAPLVAAEFTKFDRIYVLSGMILITLGINLYAVTFILNNLFQFIRQMIEKS